jgi:uncharacterized repeat protein (TIGR04076 family)
MTKIKITVLRRSIFEDLVKEYAVKDYGLCQAFQDGQVFYTDYRMPEGFCGEAWKAIYQYVFALYHGGTDIYNGHWIDEKKHPGTVVSCCNDGLRPVVFKIERIEDTEE